MNIYFDLKELTYVSDKKKRKKLFLVLSSKVFKKAYERNLIKRRLRAIIYPFLKKEKKKYLLIVKPPIKDLSFQELKSLLEESLKK